MITVIIPLHHCRTKVLVLYTLHKSGTLYTEAPVEARHTDPRYETPSQDQCSPTTGVPGPWYSKQEVVVPAKITVKLVLKYNTIVLIIVSVHLIKLWFIKMLPYRYNLYIYCSI